jgi:hypothetical protein
MNPVWRTFTAMLALGLSVTAMPVLAQSEQGGNPHFNALTIQLEKQEAVDRTQAQKKLATLRQAIESLPADQRAKAQLVAWGVPAISSIKRMPDTVPADGVAGKMIPAVAARGEYSPLSFVVAPLKDIAKLEVRATDLKSGRHTISDKQVDVKIIKVWYQTGTAWHSYFADPTHRVLVPELLLNDDDLIRVDHQTKDNYLRVDYPSGSKYVWISAPPDVDDGKFNHFLEPVADSPTLKPVAMQAGQSRQFWVTIHVPTDAAEGVYQGNIELLADGVVVTRLPVVLRVLPFELPLPRTYHDLDRPFYSMVYSPVLLPSHIEATGGDQKLAETKMRAELENLRKHNIFHHKMRGRREWDKQSIQIFERELELIRDAKFVPPLFSPFSASGSVFYPKYRNPERYKQYLRDAQTAMDLVKKVLGHSDVYMFGFDEPGMTVLLAQQDGWKDLQKLGAKIYSTSKDSHYPSVGYGEMVSNYAGTINRQTTAKWNLLGHGVMNYASPHTGPENPEFNRRFHGLPLYKSMAIGTGNYKYYDQQKIWNDFASTRFRGFNLVYPTQTNVIDTMAWEGFRVGLDDVRYATLLKLLAAEAIASDNIDAVYAGKKALLWLEQVDEKNGDLDYIRIEMINYILELRKHLGKAGV